MGARPTAYRSYTTRAIKAAWEGSYQEADTSLAAALPIAGNHTDSCLFNLGLVNLLLGKQAKATNYLRQAVGATPSMTVRTAFDALHCFLDDEALPFSERPQALQKASEYLRLEAHNTGLQLVVYAYQAYVLGKLHGDTSPEAEAARRKAQETARDLRLSPNLWDADDGQPRVDIRHLLISA